MKTNSPFEKQPLASLEDPPIIDSQDARRSNLKNLAAKIQNILGYNPSKFTRQEVLHGDHPSFTKGMMHLHDPKNGGINIAQELTEIASDLETALDEAPDENAIPQYLKYVHEARSAAHSILNAENQLSIKQNDMLPFADRRVG